MRKLGQMVWFNGCWNILYNITNTPLANFYHLISIHGTVFQVQEPQFDVLPKGATLSIQIGYGSHNELVRRSMYLRDMKAYLDKADREKSMPPDQQKVEEAKEIDFSNDRELLL